MYALIYYNEKFLVGLNFAYLFSQTNLICTDKNNPNFLNFA